MYRPTRPRYSWTTLRVLFAGAFLSFLGAFGAVPQIDAASQSAVAALRINSGGPALGGFSADALFVGGTTASSNKAIDISGVRNPAPRALYQSERWGAFTYTAQNLKAGSIYTVRLHFAEFYFDAAGKRKFNVSINGTQVLKDFDIVAVSGANKAVVREFTPMTNADGQIMIAFSNGAANNPKVSGIEVVDDGGSAAATDLTVNCGGGANDPFATDGFYSGGSVTSTKKPIDLWGAPQMWSPAPEAVYQSERYGTFTYAIPNAKPGSPYIVRLHFAEIFFTSAGQRKFNVAINGEQVLKDFDIVAAAGAPNTAVAREFYTTANDNGQVVIAFTKGSANNPKVSGIEVRSNPMTPTGLTAKVNTTNGIVSVEMHWTPVNVAEQTLDHRVYRSTISGFTPSPETRVDCRETPWSGCTDLPLDWNTTYHYMVVTDGMGDPSTRFSITTPSYSTSDNTTRVKISRMLVGTSVWISPSEEAWNLSSQMGLKTMRIGGWEYDRNPPSMDQLLDWVARIKKLGAEPMMQVSRLHSAAEAADQVKYFNITTGNRIHYWNIGSDPCINGYICNDSSAQTVADYVKTIASAMKAVDPSIKIFAPDYYLYMNKDLYDALIGGGADITGKDAAGRYYVDGIAWHLFADHDDLAVMGAEEFLVAIQKMSARVSYANQLNGRAGADTLQWGLGEFNGTYGYRARTYDNGQMLAQIYGYVMKYGGAYANVWSMTGSGANFDPRYDVGFVNDDNTPRPSYYQMQMVAKNFTGDYVDGKSSAGTVRAFGAVDSNKVTVMLVNVGKEARSCRVHLNNEVDMGTCQVNINANQPVTYPQLIDGESTMVLTFNGQGQLVGRITYSNSSPIAPPVEIRF